MKRKSMSVRTITATGLFCGASLAGAEVLVSVSPPRITLNEAVQVTFESRNGTVATPDLSPLLRDFEIVNRSTRRHSSMVNGRGSSRNVLTLTLVPKRAGNLSIPGIAFGKEISQPRMVFVEGGAETDYGLATPSFDSQYRNWQAYPNEPYNYGQPRTQGGTGGYDTPPFATQTPSYFGSIEPPVNRYPDASQELQQLAPAPATEYRERAGSFPSWLAPALAAGWLATVAFCWARRRRGEIPVTRAPAAPAPPPQPPPKTELEKAEDAAEHAYKAADAHAARDAWLHWAALRWPQDKPANLMGLAERLQDPARAAVLLLDEALYSPTPIAWQDVPIRTLLRYAKRAESAQIEIA